MLNQHLSDDFSCQLCVWRVQYLSQQHGLEEGPGHSTPCCVHHIQIEVHTEGTWRPEHKQYIN